MQCRKCLKSIPDGATFCPWCGVRQSKKPSGGAKKPKSRGNGTGTVFQDKNGSWTAQMCVGKKMAYSKDGTERVQYIRRTKKGFALKREAIAYLSILSDAPKTARTLNDYWLLWQRDELSRLSASKRTAYNIAWGKLSDISLRDISTLAVEDLRAIVKAKAPTHYPARDIKTLLSHLYKLAGADGTANPDLPSYIVLPSLDEKEQQPFNEMEIRCMWTAYEAGDYFVGYLLMMIYSGMMPGELLGLKCDMIDLAGNRIIGAGIKTKERKRTAITIADFMVPVISALMERSKGDKFLSINRDNFYTQYHETLTRCNCRDLPPYSCRHSTATALSIGQNIAPAVIRKVMRWSSTKMLDRYAHASTSDALSAVNALASTAFATANSDSKIIDK